MRPIIRRYHGYDPLINEHWFEESNAHVLSENILLFIEDDGLIFEKVETVIEADHDVVEVRYDDELRKKFEIPLPDELLSNLVIEDVAKLSLFDFSKLVLNHI